MDARSKTIIRWCFIAFLVVGEIAILVVTWQYEAAIAPAGSTLFLGMAAAGMLAFIFETFKLPVAFVSGTQTRGKRILFYISAGVLCTFTAVTTADIFTRDWNLALAPSRAAAAAAGEMRAEIDALQQTQVQLAQNTQDAEVFWNARITATNAELESLETKKTAAQTRYIERLNALMLQAIDPLIAKQVATIQKRQDDEAVIAKTNLTELNEQLAKLNADIIEERTDRGGAFDRLVQATIAERNRIQEQNEAGAVRANGEFTADTEQFNKESEAYSRAKVAHSESLAKVAADLQVEIASLRENDKPFFDLKGEEQKARIRADEKTSGIEGMFKRLAEPKPPTRRTVKPEPLPPIPSRTTSPDGVELDQRIVTMNTRIETAKANRDLVQAECAAEMKKFLDKAQESSGSSRADSTKSRALLETDFSQFNQQLDREMSALLTQRAEQNAQRTTLLNPAEVQLKLQAIPEQLKKLNSDAEKAESESTRLRTDTNANRVASALRWGWPDAEDARLEEIAYLFPVWFGILAAFLPALLLELVVHSLFAPTAARRKSQWNILHRVSRGRRALIRERGIAAAKIRRADVAQATFEEVRAKCESEAEAMRARAEADSIMRIELQEQHRKAFETEIRLRTEALDLEIDTRAAELHQELAAARDQATLERDEARAVAGVQVAAVRSQADQAAEQVTALRSTMLEQNQTLLKQRADIVSLCNAIYHVNAGGSVPPGIAYPSTPPV